MPYPLFNKFHFYFRIKFGKLIGEGSFGSVYLAENTACTGEIAAKQMPLLRFGAMQSVPRERCIA